MTSPLDRLYALNQSWNQVDRLSDMVLDIVAGNPVIKKRPPYTFLSFFTGFFHSSHPEFSTSLQSVKALFSQVAATEQNPDLITLQQRISSLGRHIFVQKKANPFSFSSEPLINFEVRHFMPTQLPAPSIIKMGLPNHSLTHCWLNSALMYVAVTDHYDTLFLEPLDNPSLEPFRQSLCRLIAALRCNENQLVIDALHQELCQHLKTGCFNELCEGQQDASEFLLFLQQNALKGQRPVDQQVHSVILYQSEDDSIFRPGDPQPPDLPLIISPKDRGEINLQTSLEVENLIPGISHYFRKEQGQYWETDNTEDKRDFKSRCICTHLPKIVEIHIKRGHLAIGVDGFQADDIDQKIKIDGSIELFEYEPLHTTIDDKLLITGARAKTRCLYKVVATIERIGKTTERGHYATNALTTEGVIRYSDMTVEAKDAEVFKDAYLLQLECISREAIEEPIETLPITSQESDYLPEDKPLLD